MSDEPKKLKKKEYWGPEQEAFVKEYLLLPIDDPKAEALFEAEIYAPLKKLVENIMFTYRLNISELPIHEQIYDTMGFVVSKFRKFDPERGHKSFSYFGTIAKNYFIMKKNSHNSKNIKSVDIESVLGFEFANHLYEDHEFETEITSYTYLFNMVADNLEDILSTDLTLDRNVYLLGEAVVYLLRNYQYINVFNKRQFYFVAKEFTGLSAKEITKAMVKIKEVFKENYKMMY